jgi:hypothetical protein
VDSLFVHHLIRQRLTPRDVGGDEMGPAGLKRITLQTAPGIEAAPPDPLRFCRDVVPLV